MEIYLGKQQVPLSPVPRSILLFPRVVETLRLEVVVE